MLIQMHPLLSPFTSYEATMSRLMRFSIYILQANIIFALIGVYFGYFYRMNEVASLRNSEVLDQTDFYHIMGVSTLGSLLLLPFWFTNSLTSAVANRIQKTTEPMAAFLNVQVVLLKRNVA